MATAVPVNGKHQTQPPPPIGENSEAPAVSQSALVYDEIVKRFTSSVRFGWHELGSAVKAIKDGNLWKVYAAPEGELPFHSFEDYVNRRGQRSRRALYRAYGLRIGLTEVSEVDAGKMSQANAIWLLRMKQRVGPKKAMTPQNIAKALSMQEDEFAEYCNGQMPGAAAEEPKVTITWKMDKSQARIVEKAMNVACWEVESKDDRDAIERICSVYLDTLCEHEGFKSFSNLQAYQRSHGRPWRKKEAGDREKKRRAKAKK